MRRFIPLLLLFLFVAATPAPSVFPTVEGCAPALAVDGVCFTEGIATGHRFAFWFPLQNDPSFGVLAAYNDGGQFLGWCLLANGPAFHVATAAELAPLGAFEPGWRNPNGTIQATIPPPVMKLLTPKHKQS